MESLLLNTFSVTTAASSSSLKRNVVRPRRLVVVRAEAAAINPAIRKTEEKVVDTVVVTELSKPLTAYCRYRSSQLSLLCPVNITRIYSI